MSRISAKALFEDALANQYSVGYFEGWDVESCAAVVRAAENMKAPVMIGVCGTYVGEPKRQYPESLAVYAAALKKMAEEASVPVALLLNEADDEQMVKYAADLGFDMVMYAPVFAEDKVDADQVFEIQKRISRHAHKKGAFVEGEVGELPLYTAEGCAIHGGEDTDPEECAQYVAATGIDLVAVSVGNCHLREGSPAVINHERLRQIAQVVPVPLVLHGGTSISREDLTLAASEGVVKVNFGTAMKRLVIDAAKRYYSENDTDKMNPNDVLGRGCEKDLAIIEQEVVIRYVEETIAAMNAAGKAVSLNA